MNVQAKELRLGNLILQEFPTTMIISVEVKHISWIKAGSTTFQPIPLTEEWLLRFGFERDMPSAVPMLRNEFIEMHYWVEYKEIIFASRSLKVQYVHQLQNLYFALTGQELEVKELSNA